MSRRSRSPVERLARVCGVLLWLGLVLLLVPVGPVLAGTKVVFLRNGDRLTGELLSENSRRIVIRTPATGRVTLQRDQIERIEEFPLRDLASPGQPPAVPSAIPTATNPPVAVAPLPKATGAVTNAPPTVDPSTNAVAVSSLLWLPNWAHGLWTNWHGNVQIGANFGVGTANLQSTYANANVVKKWGRTTTLLNYALSYGIVNDAVNANRMYGTFKTDLAWSAQKHVYSYGQGAAGYDEIRRINLEYLAGAGMGYRVIDRSKTVLAAELGAQYQVFDYLTAQDRADVAARFGENLTAQIGKDVRITQQLGFTPGFDDFTNYQIRFGLTLSVALFKPLTLNLNVIDTYLSQPAPGTANNDLQASTTIGINF
ncbi:MAG: DUF481 domain-containing protein [Verrucomicrobia bacterium]|nr:DUF481 domain-containing protein [Verrucomicrobiota bacterium]